MRPARGDIRRFRCSATADRDSEERERNAAACYPAEASVVASLPACPTDQYAMRCRARCSTLEHWGRLCETGPRRKLTTRLSRSLLDLMSRSGSELGSGPPSAGLRGT
jgi:hypothetical protein